MSDLPLFIDPFLLFNSVKPNCQKLHEDMIDYLVFLRDKAGDDLDPALIANWYRFKEVEQNWLGFTLLGNGGRALGDEFARALHASLGKILADFGEGDEAAQQPIPADRWAGKVIGLPGSERPTRDRAAPDQAGRQSHRGGHGHHGVPAGQQLPQPAVDAGVSTRQVSQGQIGTSPHAHMTGIGGQR
jgi:hypothetical protein